MSRGELMRISRTETQSVYNQSKMETMQTSLLGPHIRFGNVLQFYEL